MMENNCTFEEWAIIELMGHQKIAGRVSEQAIGGCSFLRVDVPPVNGSQPITKFYTSKSIYCVTIVDEETAKLAVPSCQVEPVNEWTVKEYLRALPSGNNSAGPDISISRPTEEDDDNPFL